MKKLFAITLDIVVEILAISFSLFTIGKEKAKVIIVKVHDSAEEIRNNKTEAEKAELKKQFPDFDFTKA